MFILTLPIIFEHTNLLTPLALLLIFTLLLGLLYIITPTTKSIVESKIIRQSIAQESKHYQQKYHFLYQAWYGNMPLWKVFWPYFIIVNWVLYASDWATRATILSVPTWDNILLVCIVSALWWFIGVWRMSPYCGQRIYAAVAQLLTLALFADFILRIFIRIQYPRIFFDCEGMLFNYSSCF